MGFFFYETPREGLGGYRVKISHLLFAYDTLVFCEASQDQITYLC